MPVCDYRASLDRNQRLQAQYEEKIWALLLLFVDWWVEKPGSVRGLVAETSISLEPDPAAK